MRACTNDRSDADRMSPAPVLAVATTTAALQQALRLLRVQPYTVAISVPLERAARTVEKLRARYPSITAHRNAQSALRGLGLPCVQLLVMPPHAGNVTLLLVATAPPDDREPWRLALDPVQPLLWRGYQLTTVATMQAEADQHRRPQPRRAGDAERLTWRLAPHVRQAHRTTITRLCSAGRPAQGRNRRGGPRAGTTRSPEGAHAQLQALGRHLGAYPGLNGINVDRWLLARHMQRQWRQHHAQIAPPLWPRYPYVRAVAVRYAPLPVPAGTGSQKEGMDTGEGE